MKGRKTPNKSMIILRDSMVGTPCPLCLVIMGPSNENTWISATIDHISRLADGGKNNLQNTAIVCKSCNTARGTTAQHMKRQKRLGYAKWAVLSLNVNCKDSQAVIATLYSDIDSEFWHLAAKRGASRPY